MRAAAVTVSFVAVFLAGMALVACSPEQAEHRARLAAETMRESLPDIDRAARAQRLPPEVVRSVQQQLQAVHEYQGEISGELDAVTLTAIQAFQRAQGLHDDGVLDAHTRARLAAVASAPQ